VLTVLGTPNDVVIYTANFKSARNNSHQIMNQRCRLRNLPDSSALLPRLDIQVPCIDARTDAVDSMSSGGFRNSVCLDFAGELWRHSIGTWLLLASCTTILWAVSVSTNPITG